MFTDILKELAALSHAAGARPDYVQGGGGNTSVKLGSGLMAVKASGIRLGQVTESAGFTIVETETLREVTAEHGYKPLRPSVESGFHAALPEKFVLHTHAVYANLAMCSETGAERLPGLMEGYEYVVVPYRNPGMQLCSSIKERLGYCTQVIFLENHGLIVTAATAEECLRIHDGVNDRIAESYGVTPSDYAAFAAELDKTLYPDHQVYFTLTDAQREIQAAVMFIRFTLMKNGEKARAMDGRAMDYIKNWESEAYRKTMTT
jgi:ribulose-5-phosphate 4-epimerase/fuculose-1-phosphate aldolase